MMNPYHILVCVRAPMAGKQNDPLRLSALDGAMQLAREVPEINVSALALDEVGGEDALRMCLAHIADTAFLVQGPAVDAADAVAAAYLMAEAVQIIEHANGPFDLICCADSDVGQEGLGPALAGCLNRPQVTGALNARPEGQQFLVQQRWDNELAQIKVERPCVVSFLCSPAPAHYPQLPRLMAANAAELHIIPVSIALSAWNFAFHFERAQTKRVLMSKEMDLFPQLVELLTQESLV